MTEPYTFTLYKQGNRVYGEVRVYPDGTKIYYAWRVRRPLKGKNKGLDEIYYDMKSPSAAMREGRAGWAIDQKTIFDMNGKVINKLGILVMLGRKRGQPVFTGEEWLTSFDNYKGIGESKLWYAINYEGRNGSFQRVLPLKHFEHTRAPTVMMPGA
jgi:hypothetical protein